MEADQKDGSMKRKTRVFRKRFVINRRFQFNFILQALAITLGVILIGRIFESFYILDLIDQTLGEVDTRKSFVENIHTLKSRLVVSFWLKSAVLFVAITLWGLITSHKIAGPFYKLGNILDAYNRGDLNDFTVKFRKGDYFQEIAEKISKAFKRDK